MPAGEGWDGGGLGGLRHPSHGGAAGVGTGTERAARCAADGLVKSLTIFMCVVPSAKGLNLYSFSAPPPRAPYELPNIQ